MHFTKGRYSMKTFITLATVLSLAGLLLIPGAFAQTSTSPGSGSETTTMPGERPASRPSTTMGAASELYASNLIGADVKNQQGETLGEIKELVLDPREAKIKNAVVAVGGVLGLGAKTVAIPWEKMTLQSDGRAVVVAMGKEELQNAPEWKKAEEPRPTREPATTSPTSPRPAAPAR
jgi:sporulation protein YlmC with PRC-barrel domain